MMREPKRALSPGSSSANKIRPRPCFCIRIRHSGFLSDCKTTHHPYHIACQIAHRLHAFRVLPHLVRVRPVNLRPILGADKRHIIDREVLYQPVERGGGACAAAGHYRRSELILQPLTRGTEQPVHKRADLRAGAAVMHRRSRRRCRQTRQAARRRR